MGPVWGIDLGGTKIEGIILEDKTSLNVIKRMRIPTEAAKGYSHIIRQIYKLVETMTAEVGVRPQHIGFSTPGTLDPLTQTMKNCNTTCLNGMPLKRDLEELFGFAITIANDANCFAIAEARLGAVPQFMPDARVVFGIIMGTGVGGGVVVNGKILTGRHGIAGEWGHNFLDESGGPCYCGQTGCVERVLSGPALEKYYRNLTGNPLRMPEIYQRYLDNTDPDATATVERMIVMFGRAVSSIVNMLDPDAIVLGGGLSNLDILYSEGTQEVEKHVFNNRLETLFMRPRLGDSAGVFGAALLI